MTVVPSKLRFDVANFVLYDLILHQLCFEFVVASAYALVNLLLFRFF